MASYRCDTCGGVYDFPSTYPTIYCQGFAPDGRCDGLCKRLSVETPAKQAGTDGALEPAWHIQADDEKQPET